MACDSCVPVVPKAPAFCAFECIMHKLPSAQHSRAQDVAALHVMGLFCMDLACYDIAMVGDTRLLPCVCWFGPLWQRPLETELQQPPHVFVRVVWCACTGRL